MKRPAKKLRCYTADPKDANILVQVCNALDTFSLNICSATLEYNK